MQVTKDPDAVLDYAFNWASWLSEGVTISDYTITAEDGLTVDSDSEADGVVTVWLSGGTDGERYEVTCRVITSAAQQDDRTMLVVVRER